MSRLIVRQFDDPQLSEVCHDLSPDDDLFFLDDMLVWLAPVSHAGVITAPQISLARCAAVLRPQPDEPLMVMLNPVILRRDTAVAAELETCPSCPDLVILVDRHIGVLCRYFDAEWRLHERQFSGPPARLIQHAIEHLQGRCALVERGAQLKGQ